MCHLLRLEVARRVVGGSGVSEMRREDIKAPRARKSVSGGDLLLKKTQGIGVFVDEVEELGVGTLGSMDVKLKARDMSTWRTWHQEEEGKV